MKIIHNEHEGFKPFSIKFETDKEARALRVLLGDEVISNSLSSLFQSISGELIKQGYPRSLEDYEAKENYKEW